MLRTIKQFVFVLGACVVMTSCEQSSVLPRNKVATSTTANVEKGDKIINPLPGTQQRPGLGIEMGFGKKDGNGGCSRGGICYIKITATNLRVQDYPIAGEGTGFFSQPEKVDPKTGLGTMRIIFTQSLENINQEKVFDTGNGETVFDAEASKVFGYEQVAVVEDEYPIIHGDGSETNPFGYVDVQVRCK